MDLIALETQSAMFSYLNDSGCCYTCCLRLIGRQKSDTADNLSSISPMTINDKVDPCIACLGILENDIQVATLKQVLQVVQTSGYDSDTFNCALTIPISHSLRDKSLHLSLAKQFELSDSQLYALKNRMSSVKEFWKTQVLPQIEAATTMQFVSGPVPSNFSIEISISHQDDESDCKKLLSCFESNVRSKHRHSNDNHSRNKVEKILSTIDDEKFMECFPVPPPRSSTRVSIDKISCTHGSIFVGGRYCKLSRRLSQTPWFINGEKKMETSVQDLLSQHIIDVTKADNVKFLASGREDVDVRTLNSGRPFAIELINPRITKISSKLFSEITNKINASTQLVRVTNDLRFLTTFDLKRLKEGENVKTKFYRALCIARCESPCLTIDLEIINKIKGLEITQETPIRVLHRRPLVPRVRIIHMMRARWLTQDETAKVQQKLDQLNVNQPSNSRLFVLDIKTQAGTYVKEYVHGDLGRTRPSLGDFLGTQVDIVALDVTGINIHWP